MLRQREHRKKKYSISTFKPCTDVTNEKSDTLPKQVIQIGVKVKVHWDKEEVKKSGWWTGWYVVTIHSYHDDTDTLTVTYTSELHDPYEVP